MAKDLSGPAGDPEALCIAADATAMKGADLLPLLRGRMVVACRPGFSGRAVLAAEGCAIVPSPVRARPLLEALERATRPEASGPRPLPAAVPGRPAPSDKGGTAGTGDHGQAGGPEGHGADFKGRKELVDYLSVIGNSIAARDVEGLERESRRFRDIFQGVGAEAAEKLAFSVLLCSRKGDWAGLEDLAGKGRRMLETAPVGKDVGGKANAIPGR
jgi:hypothetical protein